MNHLEQQIELLEDELDAKARETRQLKRALSRYEELLERKTATPRKAGS